MSVFCHYSHASVTQVMYSKCSIAIRAEKKNSMKSKKKKNILLGKKVFCKIAFPKHTNIFLVQSIKLKEKLNCYYEKYFHINRKAVEQLFHYEERNYIKIFFLVQ